MQKRPVIVVVEDEAPIMALICMVLDGADMLPLPCMDSSTALDLIHAIHPDLVMLDVQMPKLNGVKLFLSMQDDAATEHIPVVFCTASLDALLQKLPNYRELGAGCITKPFNNGRLAAEVRKWLAA